MITLVTGNPNKLKEAKMILGEELQSESLDLFEPQTMDLEEIARTKVRQAFEKVKGPVMVEDVSYEVDAVNKFPGVFVKFWEKSGLHDVVLANIEKTGNPKARAICAVAYKDETHELFIRAVVEGRHVPKTDGNGWGFDYYFIPDGYEQSFAQMGPEEKIKISHRFHAYSMLKTKLLENGISL
jgi:non-canonical purine NTP pyrophosphatase (RdgB/HAM1 family)